MDYQNDLVNRTNGRFRYFIPCFPTDNYRDLNFNIAGQYLNIAGGNRHRARTANTSSTCCTKTRWPVEALFGKESNLNILGSNTKVPQQYLSSCGIPGFESQSVLAIWLHIGDSLLYHHGTPMRHNYPTVDTYLDHGNDIRNRIGMENPLSEFSGIQWSRNNIFQRLTQREQTRQGGQIQHVFLLNTQQTGMTAITTQELSSITLGSFQSRMVRSYGTHLR